jgi:hypothetical protein
VSQAGGKYQEIYNMLIDTNCWWLLKYNILPPPFLPDFPPQPFPTTNNLPIYCT